MPPRRKATITTDNIKGIIPSEEMGKAVCNDFNQDRSAAAAAASKGKVNNHAISANEEHGTDTTDVPNTRVSVRSSKQRALQKILAMEKDDTAGGMTKSSAKNDALASGANHNNGKKKGPRTRKAPNSIPKNVDIANVQDQVPKIVSKEGESKLCANEVKHDRGKSRIVHMNEGKLSREQEEIQQGMGPQPIGNATCSRANHNNGEKKGPRARKALNSIPEDVDMANVQDQVPKIVSKEEESKLCANEVKHDRGKSRSVHMNEGKLSREQEEMQQGMGPQPIGNATCSRASRKRGASSMVASGVSTSLSHVELPGDLLKKKTECPAKPTERSDSLSTLMACSGERTQPEPKKKEQALNVRSSARVTKAVNYKENSPGGDLKKKELFLTGDLQARVANQSNDSVTTMQQSGAKRCKEEQLSPVEEALALVSARPMCANKGQRRQKPSSTQNLGDKKNDTPQDLVDKETGAFVDHKRRGNKEMSGENQIDGNIKGGYSSSAVSKRTDMEKAISVQAGQIEIVNPKVYNTHVFVPSPAQEGPILVLATSLERVSSYTGNVVHEKRELDHITHNKVCQKKVLSERSQDQMVASEPNRLELLSTTVENVLDPHKSPRKAVNEHASHALSSANDRKTTNTKKRRVNSKRRALPDAAEKAEGYQLESLPLRKLEVLEAPLVQRAATSTTDAQLEEMCGTHGSVDADKKLYCESRNRGRITMTRKKRPLQGTALQAKRQKSSELQCLDTLPSPAADILVESARLSPAQATERKKVIQGGESQDWSVVEIDNSIRRAEWSFEKRREELKRKRASRFDALPVGFGLGISCWSTPPWVNQSTEEGLIEAGDSSVISYQVHVKSPLEEAMKPPYPEEAAMVGLLEVGDSSVIGYQVHVKSPLEEAMKPPSPEEAAMVGLVEIGDSSVIGYQVHVKSPLEEAMKPPYPEEAAMVPKYADNSLLVLQDTIHALPCLGTDMPASSFSVPVAAKLPENSPKPAPEIHPYNQQRKAKAKKHVSRKKTESFKLRSPPTMYRSSDNSMLEKENMAPKHHAINIEHSEPRTRRSSRRRLATVGKE